MCKTTIRVRFADRTQLEKAFPSSSKIRAVYAFVRDSLREDVKPIKFVLCAFRSTFFLQKKTQKTTASLQPAAP